MDFSLYEIEEKVIVEAEGMVPSFAEGPQRAAYASLLDAFKRGLREKRRLIRLFDRQQEQLALLNQELQRSKQAAEDALVRLQQTQESLVHAEKMASLGTLVAGVAHEINTPVGIALSAASYLHDQTATLRERVRDGRITRSAFSEYLDTATDATGLVLSNCERAAQLIQGFKQVAVDQTSAERRSFNMAEYLREVLVSLGPRLRKVPHQVVVTCPSDLVVNSYPGALSQVITNFVINSLVHAFDEGRAGTLSILVDQPEADLVRLRYGDDGCGIAEEHQTHIFDPFFTTRRGQGGTGLGLHVVYNTVTATLKGHVTVDSTVGRGTIFTVTFPREVPQ